MDFYLNNKAILYRPECNVKSRLSRHWISKVMPVHTFRRCEPFWVKFQQLIFIVRSLIRLRDLNTLPRDIVVRPLEYGQPRPRSRIRLRTPGCQPIGTIHPFFFFFLTKAHFSRLRDSAYECCYYILCTSGLPRFRRGYINRVAP